MVLNNLIHTGSYSASSRHHYSIAAYFYLHLRRNLPYSSFSPPRRIAPAESIHQAGEFQLVRDAEQRPLPAQDLLLCSDCADRACCESSFSSEVRATGDSLRWRGVARRLRVRWSQLGGYAEGDALRIWNDRLSFIRVSALLRVVIHGCGYVVVSLPGADRAVGVCGRTIERSVDHRVRTTRHRAAV